MTAVDYEPFPSIAAPPYPPARRAPAPLGPERRELRSGATADGAVDDREDATLLTGWPRVFPGL